MMTTKRHPAAATLALLLLVAALALAPSARAYDLPAVNLGFTSFLDGGPPAGPGFYFAQYFQYYQAKSLRGPDGTEIFPNPLFPDAKVDAWISLSQFIVQCPKKLVLGAQPGLDVIVPVAELGISGTPLRANRAGMGDLLVGPYLQWEPIMGKNGPIFMHRIEFQCLLPVGRYDPQFQLNPGAHHFSFNPYWSGTLFITPKLTLSTRLHYLWNDANEKPDVSWSGNPLWNAGGHNRMQPGQALHLNFATEYELIEKRLRIGFNGYHLTQISDTRFNGQKIPQRREEVIGLGPGMLYSFSQNTHLFLNAYFETAAENRTEGMRFQLRLVHHF